MGVDLHVSDSSVGYKERERERELIDPAVENGHYPAAVVFASVHTLCMLITG